MSDKPTTDTSRRDFMKTSTAAALGAGVLGSLAVSPRAYASGSDTVRVGLVGCGGRGTGAASQALSTEGPVKLVAMADAFRDRLEASYRRLKSNFESEPGKVAVDEDHKFAGFDAYRKLIDSGVDLVILATPPGFRPIHFEAAVKANKHVFQEKPLATDAPGIRKVLEAGKRADEKGLKVGVGLQRHHQKHYLEALEKIRDGAIGDVVALRCYWNGGGVWDPRKTREEVSGEMEYQMRNWYYYTWLCGDHIVEQHIHNIDVGNWIRDAHPVTAYGMGGREVRTDPKYGQIFDHHDVEFVYEDGTRMYSQCRHIRGCWNSVSEHAHGTKGTAHLSSGGAEIVRGEDRWRDGRSPNPYQVEHDDLFAAIREDRPYNETEYGAHSTMTAIMGRMATYSGKPIQWDEALNSGKSLMPETFAWDAEPPVLPDENGRYPVAVPGIYDPFA